MKKAFFAGFVVLLALALITCDVFPPSDKGPKLVKVDGLDGVELSIEIGRSGRALTGPNAEIYTDFYEVTFKGPNDKIYRATWRAGQKGRIAVPFGDYTGTDPSTPGTPAAIIFAGKYSDHTLLGVGKLTSVNSIAGATINSQTTSVTFTLEPLENEIKESGGTFEVTTSGAATPNDVKIKSDGRTITIPLFPVVKDDDNTAMWSITCPNDDGVFILDEGTLDSVGILTDAPIAGFKVSTIAGAVTPDSNTINAASGEFILAFHVPDKEGLSSLFIDIPVCALEPDPDTFPEIWHIRGGLKNYDFDEGSTENSLGGAILIGTQAFAGPFELTGKY